MKHLILLFFIIQTPGLCAQSDSGVIKVTGKSELKVKPDKATFYFSLIGDGSSAKQAAQNVKEKLKQLKRTIKSLDYADSVLKVGTIYTHGNRRKGDKTTSYTARYSAEVSVEATSESVTSLTEAFEESNLNINTYVQLGLYAHTSKALSQELIEKAIDDATSKAQIIANRIGRKLDGIRLVEYGESQFRFHAASRSLDYTLESASYANNSGPELNFQEQTLNETIYLEFNTSAP